jgi:hypothetical protein
MKTEYFNDEIEQIAGSRHLESYQDHNESNGGPSAIEASKSVEPGSISI